MRGPLVYCIEEADNGPELAAVRLPKEPVFSVRGIRDDESPLNGMTVIDFKGTAAFFPSAEETLAGEGAEAPFEELYSEEQPAEREITVRAIPYYAWGNRGGGSMRVWMYQK